MFKISYFAKAALLTALAFVVYSCGGSEEKKEAPSKKEETSFKRHKTVNDVAEINPGQSENVFPSTGEDLSKPREKLISKAFCVVNARSGSEVVGAVTFTEVEGGVRIVADVGGLNPGKHGFHIHEHGDCSAHDATSAGGHFNPTNKKHGGPDSFERHVGDLGNLEANEYGFAHYDRVDSLITLNGEQSIIGKSIIIHADEDDLVSDPTGNAGARIACGEIMESEL